MSFLRKLSFLFVFLFLGHSCFSQVNVGNALNNLNSRTSVLETRANQQDLFNLTNRVKMIWDRKNPNNLITLENKTGTVWEINGSVTSKVYSFATDQSVNQIESNLYAFISSGGGFVKPVLRTVNLNVYSNAIYSVTSGTAGITFPSPVIASNKESRFVVHLYKNSGNVTWFSPITWVYGEAPQWEYSNKTYVISLESIDNGQSWRGWVEYIY